MGEEKKMVAQNTVAVGRMEKISQLFCAWSGIVFVVLYLIGFVPLAHFIPAPSPSLTAEEVASIYRNNATGIQIGMLIDMIAAGFIAPWGGLIAARCRRHERGIPSLSTAQLALTAIGTVVAMVLPLVWALAAFRPDETPASTIAMLNDCGWYLLLFTFPIFSLWNFVIAMSILLDDTGSPAFPRWLGFLNIWCGLLLFPAGAILFFKSGPFAYNGVLALYLPLVAFFIWMIAMSFALIMELRKDEKKGRISIAE